MVPWSAQAGKVARWAAPGCGSRNVGPLAHLPVSQRPGEREMWALGWLFPFELSPWVPFTFKGRLSPVSPPWKHAGRRLKVCAPVPNIQNAS